MRSFTEAVLSRAIIVIFSINLDGEKENILITVGYIQLVGALIHRRPGLEFAVVLNWREPSYTSTFFIRDNSRKTQLNMYHYVRK